MHTKQPVFQKPKRCVSASVCHVSYMLFFSYLHAAVRSETCHFCLAAKNIAWHQQIKKMRFFLMQSDRFIMHVWIGEWWEWDYSKWVSYYTEWYQYWRFPFVIIHSFPLLFSLFIPFVIKAFFPFSSATKFPPLLPEIVWWN